MITKRIRCPKCGHEFAREVFESQEEADEYLEKHIDKRQTPIQCPECRTVCRE